MSFGIMAPVQTLVIDLFLGPVLAMVYAQPHSATGTTVPMNHPTFTLIANKSYPNMTLELSTYRSLKLC